MRAIACFECMRIRERMCVSVYTYIRACARLRCHALVCVVREFVCVTFVQKHILRVVLHFVFQCGSASLELLPASYPHILADLLVRLLRSG